MMISKQNGKLYAQWAHRKIAHLLNAAQFFHTYFFHIYEIHTKRAIRSDIELCMFILMLYRPWWNRFFADFFLLRISHVHFCKQKTRHISNLKYELNSFDTVVRCFSSKYNSILILTVKKNFSTWKTNDAMKMLQVQRINRIRRCRTKVEKTATCERCNEYIKKTNSVRARRHNEHKTHIYDNKLNFVLRVAAAILLGG